MSLAIVQGSLDVLILRVLQEGPLHGYGIVRRIRALSDDDVLVEEGSLYPALHRMEAKGWLVAEWGVSEANRRARYYRLTPAGRKRLASEAAAWTRAATAIMRVLNGNTAEN